MSLNGLDDRVRDTAGLSNYILDSLDKIETEFFIELVGAVADRAGVTKPAKDSDKMKLVVRKL